MRRVTYKSVLVATAGLWTGEQAPSAQDAAVMNVFINSRAREFWESFWWPEVMVAERRQFRPDWLIGTTYGAPSATAAVEVYYPPARKYYQSLRAGNTGNAPATLVGSDYVENSDWWAVSTEDYSGDDWATGKVFTVVDGQGMITRNPADNRYYQCFTAHTAGATFDGTKFGVLTPFVRSIDLEQAGQTKIGEARFVWDLDPNVFRRWACREQRFDLMTEGLVVRGCLPVVYVEFRKRPPSWTGDAYSSVTTYAADGQVYDGTTGDFYRSLVNGNLNNAVTDTTKWERIDFPYVLSECVRQGAFADLLRTEKDTEGFAIEDQEAKRLRDVAVTLVERQQREQMRVVG